MEDDNFETLLVNRLKKLRLQSGYSYQKLEELTGISRSSLQRYEKGIGTTNIPLYKLGIIASAYGVSPSYIMGWESKDLPNEYLESIRPLLNEAGYELNYHESNESFTLDCENCSKSISIEQIKDLKETTFSFLKFKINDILNI